MNRWRSPTLVYSSAQAIGWTSVAANVTLPAGSGVTSVNASLKVDNVTVASGTWGSGQWSPGATRRIALGFSGPAQNVATGVHDYIFEADTGGTGQTMTATGQLVIVDRSTSYFGAGWWLAGLEQWNQNTGVWIGGDGSARLYTLRPGSVAPNRVWGAPSVTYPDTIRETTSGTEFVRQMPDSVWVYFDTQGHHVRTRNSKGHITTFAYDGAGRRSRLFARLRSESQTVAAQDLASFLRRAAGDVGHRDLDGHRDRDVDVRARANARPRDRRLSEHGPRRDIGRPGAWAPRRQPRASQQLSRSFERVSS